MTGWRSHFLHPEAVRGRRDLYPFLPGIAAWGLVTGVAMVQSGLGVWLSLLMSLVVYAGSAQLAALPLLAAGAPLPVVWAAAFCVNLRFVIYSAQWRPYLAPLGRWRSLAFGYVAADINFALFHKRFPEPSAQPGQVPYFLGGALTLWVAWQAASVAGILLAERVPLHWGLGFAGTLAMLGLAYSLVVDRATLLAAVVSATAAVAAFSLPLKLNIVVAIAAAVAVGVVVEAASRRPPPAGGLAP